jgi:fructose 1,6-bisphosphatase
MRIAQQTTLPRVARGRSPIPAIGAALRAAVRPFSRVGGWFVGSVKGPRGYHRQGFPEIELHQIMAGRKDRFDDYS